MADKLNKCLCCQEVMPHSFSGSGRKWWCHGCNYVFDRKNFRLSQWHTEDDYCPEENVMVQNKSLQCSDCHGTMAEEENYMVDDINELHLCLACWNK